MLVRIGQQAVVINLDLSAVKAAARIFTTCRGPVPP